MSEHDANHFKKRQRQVLMAAGALFVVSIIIAGYFFKLDLDKAKLEQQWGVWRDDNCTLVTQDAPDASKAESSIYGPARHAGAPGVWNCSDGSTHTLHNSDQPPNGWTPPGNLQ